MVLPSVLLVDDDSDVIEAMAAGLDERFRIAAAADVRAAARLVNAPDAPDLMIADVHLQDGPEAGLALAAEAAGRKVAVLLVTGDLPLAEELEAAGYSVLRKPFRLEYLVARAKREIERSQANRSVLQQRLQYLRADTETLLAGADAHRRERAERPG